MKVNEEKIVMIVNRLLNCLLNIISFSIFISVSIPSNPKYFLNSVDSSRLGCASGGASGSFRFSYHFSYIEVDNALA